MKVGISSWALGIGNRFHNFTIFLKYGGKYFQILHIVLFRIKELICMMWELTFRLRENAKYKRSPSRGTISPLRMVFHFIISPPLKQTFQVFRQDMDQGLPSGYKVNLTCFDVSNFVSWQAALGHCNILIDICKHHICIST